MIDFLNNFLSPKKAHEREQEDKMSTTEEIEATETNSTHERPVYDGTSNDAPTSEPSPYEPSPYDVVPSPYAGMNLGGPSEMEEFETTMGEALPDGVEIADDDAVVEAMRSVFDPEIPVNIYDLGLIYNFTISDKGDVYAEMSLTAPGCPVAGEMPGMVSGAVSQIEGIGIVTTRIVWDPAWTPDRMSEDAKLALGMF